MIKKTKQQSNKNTSTKTPAMLKQERDRLVWDDYLSGLKIKDIIKKHKLSKATVNSILTEFRNISGFSRSNPKKQSTNRKEREKIIWNDYISGVKAEDICINHVFSESTVLKALVRLRKINDPSRAAENLKIKQDTLLRLEQLV